MTTHRHYSPADRLLMQADAALRTLLPFSGQPGRPSPAVVKPDAELAVIEGMNHVLRIVPAEAAQQLPSYNEPQRPLARALVERIAAFIEKTGA